MKKILVVVLVAALGVLMVGFLRARFFAPPSFLQVVVGSQIYTVEVADTAKKRSRGLGERDSLCASCAMLFVFNTSGKHAFWMQGMRFPIDIVWLSQGRVVSLQRRISPEDRTIYTPTESADQVLEFNAGVLDDIREGDTLEISAQQ